MSAATYGSLAPGGAARPRWLIGAVATLEAFPYAFNDYSVTGVGPYVPWILLSVYLLRRLWQGRYGAWMTLVALNVVGMALFAAPLFDHRIHVGGGGAFPFWQTLSSVTEIAILFAPPMRRWVRSAIPSASRIG